jgi:hypothetical protein
MKALQVIPQIAGGFVLALIAAPAQGGLIIRPTFDSTITLDTNALAIETTINSAITTYEATFADPITVDITFREGTGLGGSSFNLYTFDYSTFYNALVADGKSLDDAAALAHLATDGTGANNPVTGTGTVLIKAANAHALGLNCSPDCGADEGGTITLNTHLTNPGSSDSSGTYNLLPVLEHEMDEILGLGSTLGLGLPAPFATDPSPEDFFRFTSAGARSFNGNGVGDAYFSINGTTDLAQFDNQNDGGDFGDWRSNPLPHGVNAEVQDAFATQGANATLNVELRALDVIGYDLATPEPGTFILMGGGLVLAGFGRRRIRGAKA